MAIENCGVRRSLIGALFLSVLTVALNIRVSAVAGPPTTNTVIVNPPSSPVPVTVTNSASSPVPTQNVGGGAATQVGQRVSQLVELFCDTSSPLGKCVHFGGGSFSVPSGEALVVTDWEWTCISRLGQGNYDGLSLFANAGGVPLLNSQAPVDARQVVFGRDHLTTGVIAPPGSGPAIASANSGCSASIQGYLVPNQ